MIDINIVLDCIKRASSKYSKLTLDKIDGNQIFIHGGLNGHGDWLDYLGDLTDLIDNLQEHFNLVWIYKFDIDSLDDVFDVQIGVDNVNE